MVRVRLGLRLGGGNYHPQANRFGNVNATNSYLNFICVKLVTKEREKKTLKKLNFRLFT